MAGLARRRCRGPGDQPWRAAGAGSAPRSATGSAVTSDAARARHPGRAPAARRADHARGSLAEIWHLARASAADRGTRLREVAEGNQGCGDGPPAAPGRGALALSPGHFLAPLLDQRLGPRLEPPLRLVDLHVEHHAYNRRNAEIEHPTDRRGTIHDEPVVRTVDHLLQAAEADAGL